MTDVQHPGEPPMPIDVLAEHIERRLRVEWSDGHVSVYGFDYLRSHCECPECSCREEQADGSCVESVRIAGPDSLAITFEDGHEEMVYSFESLRRLCPCGRHEHSEATHEGGDRSQPS